MFTVAIAVFALVQVPPDVASVREVVKLIQKGVVPPDIETGGLFITLSVCGAEQPFVPVYIAETVLTVVPATNMPVDEPMDAMVVLLLVHDPPLGVPVNVAVVLTHIEVAPDTVGKEFTVITCEVLPHVVT